MVNKTIWSVCHDREGRTVIEYAMFLALIAFIYWAFTKILGQ